MLRQFDNFSTWRQDTITIQPHEVATINFKDTTPNIFVIQNSNTAMLKVGISNIPRDNSYEFKVDYNTTETVGRPFGSNNLYILNDSSIEVKISVFSIQKEFDPTILKNMNVSLNGYTIESNSEISGVMEGVTLPVEDKNSSEFKTLLKNISDNTENITLNADTVNISNEYDDTDLQSKIDFLSTMFKNYTGASDTGSYRENLYAVLSTIEKSIRGVRGNIDGPSYKTLMDLYTLIETEGVKVDTLNTAVETLNSMIEALQVRLTKKGYLYSMSSFCNNAVTFTVTAPYEELFVFDYICNDSAKPLTIYRHVNGTDTDYEILTLLPGERFENIEIKLSGGSKVFLDGEDMMFRAKYSKYRNSSEYR